MLADRFPVSSALLVTLLWSSSWVLIKLGLGTIPPLTFAGIRYSAAAGLLIAALFASPSGRRAVRRVTAATWLRIGVLGVVLYGVTQAAQFVGLALLPAATLGLFLSLSPVLVAWLSGRALEERTHRRQWLGLALAAIGAALYLRPGLPGFVGAGVLVALVALAANTASALLGRWLNREAVLPALVVTAPSMAVGGLLTLAVGLVAEPAPRLSPGSLAILGWLVVVNTALAFTLWNRVLRHLTATQASTINNTMLVQVALLGWIFLDESVTLPQWGGIALVCLGAVVVQQRRPLALNR